MLYESLGGKVLNNIMQNTFPERQHFLLRNCAPQRFPWDGMIFASTKKRDKGVNAEVSLVSAYKVETPDPVEPACS